MGAGFLTIAAAAGVTTALLADGSPSHATASVTAPNTRPVSGPASSGTARQVYNSAKDSVAYISSTLAQGQATGSGFVVSADGKIVTNAHVVDGAQQVTVKLGTSSKELPAQVLAEDTSKDLALLKVDAGGSLHPLPFADSSKVQVGQTTYAIGNPYGLDHTFTSGIVSALGREIQAPDGTPIEGAIQTDAAINPGNSGGALLDSDGRVIGVNSQIASAGASSGGEPGNVGIGFAIPSNTVKDYVANPTSNSQQQQQPQSQEQQLPQQSEGAIPQDPSQDPSQGQPPADPYGQQDPNGDPSGQSGPYEIVPQDGGGAILVPQG
jgi:putative serine protease PepD